MNREDLIKKWLNDDLTDAESKAFAELDDYDTHINIIKSAQFFKASETAEIASLSEFYERANQVNASDRNMNTWYKPFLRIAAILVVLLGVSSLFFLNSTDSKMSTLAGQKISLALPDASAVMLNAKSELAFNEKDWKGQREVTLVGEAFFKVTKGSTFDVLTQAGKVSVLGTQFNVKNRKGYFEVQCLLDKKYK